MPWYIALEQGFFTAENLLYVKSQKYSEIYDQNWICSQI